jgi:alpha-glucosidase
MRALEWWRRGVIYQIYPRSFADSDGDGIGDLRGITAHLDYPAEILGVDAIWLSPHYPSPQDDFGYDVSDYCDVDPLYGTLADFDAMVEEAHRRGLKVMVDFVPNHTSDDHPWFVESASSRASPRRDWYVWRDALPGDSLPNNWVSLFGGPAWEWHEATGQYYLHSFLASQPDLNWRNPEVKAAMFDVLRFWMDRGVDGFRVDVAQRIMKDPLLRDNPPAEVIDPESFKFNPEWAATRHIHDAAHPDIHQIFREMRRVLENYPDRFAVGEIHDWDWERWASYYGEGDELHMPFNFAPLMAGIDPRKLREVIGSMERVVPTGGWPNWVAGNHDETRLATRLGWEQSRAMAVLLLTLRGTPTLYYGDELGMVETDIAAEHQQDPYGRRVPGYGRDGCRTPMQWTPAANAGFSTCADGVTWLPVHPDHLRHNVESELADPASHLQLYRRLLRLRRAEPALHGGDIELLRGPSQLLMYRRTHKGSATFVVLANLSEAMGSHRIRGEVVVGTDHEREGRHFTGQLRPWEAVVLKTPG